MLKNLLIYKVTQIIFDEDSLKYLSSIYDFIYDQMIIDNFFYFSS
jgi:hypothetical protein